MDRQERLAARRCRWLASSNTSRYAVAAAPGSSPRFSRARLITARTSAALAADPQLADYVKLHGQPASDIFNQSFLRVIPYGIRGALWYQGEGNRDYPVSYRRLLTARYLPAVAQKASL